MATPSPEGAAPAPSSFTLRLMSPSAGVPHPFVVNNLPVSTTVQEVKERIRNSLDSRPPDQSQRLIHRGRLLMRDNETMVEVFGQEAIRSQRQQVLHLVLSSPTDHNAPTPPSAPDRIPQNPVNSQQHLPHLPRAQAVNIPGVAQMNIHHPSIGNLQQFQQQQLQNHRQIMARLAAPSQNQHPHFIGSGQLGMPTPDRSESPLPPETTRTVIREGIGPDGQRWRATINETYTTIRHPPGQGGSPFPTSGPFNPPPASVPRSVPHAGPLAGVDLQNLLRAADRTGETGSATRTMADAMRRNASTSSLGSLANPHTQQPIVPGVTIPSRTASAAGTPDPLRAAGRSTNLFSGIPPNTAQPPSHNPEVYILSSPTGPRALLVNNSDIYYTPQTRASVHPMGLPFPPLVNPPANAQPGMAPQIIQRVSVSQPPIIVNRANNAPPAQQHQGQPQQGQEGPAGDIPQLHMNQPQIQAIRLAQIWPHVWMIIRLALFIWWFTSPSSSWLRWFTVMSIALALFVLNTGVLNPLAEQVWVPVRRALENIIPMAVEHGQARPVENAHDGRHNTDAAGQQNPDPAAAAARLVRRRQNENANWLMNQARRLERAGILFLASLAPGLAERHIAQIEAEARAERQRQQEAEAAAAAAAAAATTAESQQQGQPSPDATENGPTNIDSGEASGSQAQPSDGEVRQRQHPAVVEA